MPDAFMCLDATAQAELIRKRDATPLELVDAAIARIERRNARLNAVIHERFEAARHEARAMVPGSAPFAGVPFLVKDLMCHMAGEPVHMGTRVLRDLGMRAMSDSYLAQKLRSAGFTILGRTNAPELGTLPTTEPEAYGPTRNPWNPEHSTGGSSGGSAAAVAAGFTAAAHANDGGGSIRIPASACGLFGLKPTRARISMGPDLGDAVSGLACEGFVTRSVRDTAGLLDAVAGPMPGDPYTAPAPARPYVAEVGAPPGSLRIGLLARLPGTMGPVHAECAAAATNTAQLLASLGHRVEESHPRALDEAELSQHFSVMYATNMAQLLDVLGMIAQRPMGPEDVDPLNWMLGSMGRACTAPQYLASVEWLHGWTRRMASWWADGFDLLLTPTLPEPPPALGTFDSRSHDPMVVGMRATVFSAFTAPFNMSGQPAASVPLHWTAEGLPVGVQLAAAYGREDVLLRLAAQLEQARPWAGRWPDLAA